VLAAVSEMKHRWVDLRRTVVCLTLVALAVIPLRGEIFYTRLFTRIMIYAMVASVPCISSRAAA
jgi:hypothetical protein